MKPPESLRDWAAEYRRARQSPDALAERIRGAIRAEEQAEEDEADDEEELLAPVVSSERWGLGLAIGAMLGVAALLLLSLIGRWVHPRQELVSNPQQAPFEHASESENAAISEKPAVPPRDLVRADPVQDSGSSAAVPGPAAPTHPLRRPRRERPSSHADALPDSGPEAASATPSPGSSADLLSARLLREAEHMLTSRPGAAKLLLESHARDNPRSVLSLEREALWIRAACRVGGASGLAKRRAAFARRADVSAYRAAVARDCDGTL